MARLILFVGDHGWWKGNIYIRKERIEKWKKKIVAMQQFWPDKYFFNGKMRAFLFYLNNSLEEDVMPMSFQIRNMLESCISLKFLSSLR